MNIKSASDLLGISADTIRYYERVGLVPPITRTATGIRDFQDQDIEALAERVEAYARSHPLRYGFLIRGHGLTCWGRDVSEARRQLEGLEFLFECELMRRRYERD